jgi:hypothetical protein
MPELAMLLLDSLNLFALVLTTLPLLVGLARLAYGGDV